MNRSGALPILGGTLSLTAALVNESRARQVGLSHDHYAREWIPIELRKPITELWDRFASQVYPFDDIALSVRNRFFSKLIEDAAQHERTVIVAPCGLTSYAFLTAKATRFVEIDLPDVISYKAEQAARLEREMALPKRDVLRLALDLRRTAGLTQAIRQHRHDANILLILEGLSYYLKPEQWESLAESILDLLEPEDKLAFDYWSDTDQELPAYDRYRAFCAEYAGFETEKFNFLNEKDIMKAFRGFQITQTSVFEQERHFVGTDLLASHAGDIVVDRYCVVTCVGPRG